MGPCPLTASDDVGKDDLYSTHKLRSMLLRHLPAWALGTRAPRSSSDHGPVPTRPCGPPHSNGQKGNTSPQSRIVRRIVASVPQVLLDG